MERQYPTDARDRYISFEDSTILLRQVSYNNGLTYKTLVIGKHPGSVESSQNMDRSLISKIKEQPERNRTLRTLIEILKSSETEEIEFVD